MIYIYIEIIVFYDQDNILETIPRSSLLLFPMSSKSTYEPRFYGRPYSG